MQTTDYSFHHANENMTTTIPLFSNPKNNSPQSAFYAAVPHSLSTIAILNWIQNVGLWDGKTRIHREKPFGASWNEGSLEVTKTQLT